jgi:hypothetical protein
MGAPVHVPPVEREYGHQHQEANQRDTIPKRRGEDAGL